ncbi:unnamed protein product [Rhizopus stolonifer]
MCSSFENKQTRIKEAVRNDELFQVAFKMYEEAAAKSSNPKKVMEYLNLKLKQKEKWANTYTGKLYHLEVTNSNRVEGCHANLKKKTLKPQTACSFLIQQQTNGIDKSHQHAEVIFELVHKVSLFALNAIKNEPPHLKSLKHTAPEEQCDMCSIAVHYGIPCRHTLPRFGKIQLQTIPLRWHLFPEEMETYVAKTVGVENEEGRNNDVESMKQDISKYFYQIENTLAGLKDMSQVSEIRDKMKYVAENIKSGILDLGDIMPPSTKVKLLRTKSIK